MESFFKKQKRGQKLVYLSHFVHDFWIKIILCLYPINWPNFKIQSCKKPCKKSILYVLLDCKYALERFCTGCPTKELAIPPVIECYITNELVLSSATVTLLKNQISVDVFVITALRKTLLMAPSVLWERLTDKFCQYFKQFAEVLF